jgi:glycosyltransferase involved in cell wall biosynthesis
VLLSLDDAALPTHDPRHRASWHHGCMAKLVARKITVVAQEVRLDGGMERAMMETLVGLLDLGWQVRLLARVCELDSHPGLNWTRVRTPRRPFAVAFPLFALVSGLLIVATRRTRGVIVTLGAIIPNRVDVVTVQFCHAAFARQGISRPSRDSFIHRLHSRLSEVLALSLERWCYRRGRVGRMIAVSDLIKEELESCYQLASVPIDVIPNGVDLDRFRPDANARSTERARLGLATDEPVALFVGGDWQRKGLDIAVEAAARAGWTLIVVGRGDAAAWGAHARTLSSFTVQRTLSSCRAATRGSRSWRSRRRHLVCHC